MSEFWVAVVVTVDVLTVLAEFAADSPETLGGSLAVDGGAGGVAIMLWL